MSFVDNLENILKSKSKWKIMDFSISSFVIHIYILWFIIYFLKIFLSFSQSTLNFIFCFILVLIQILTCVNNALLLNMNKEQANSNIEWMFAFTIFFLIPIIATVKLVEGVIPPNFQIMFLYPLIYYGCFNINDILSKDFKEEIRRKDSLEQIYLWEIKIIQFFDNHIKIDSESFSNEKDLLAFKEMIIELMVYDKNQEQNKKYNKHQFCDLFQDYDLTLKPEILKLLRIERHHIERTLNGGFDYVIKSDNLFFKIYDILIKENEKKKIIEEYKKEFVKLENEIKENFQKYESLITKNNEYIKEYQKIKKPKFDFLIVGDDIEQSFKELMNEMENHNGQIKEAINLISKEIQEQFNKIKEQEKEKI